MWTESVDLDDKYVKENGRIYLSGVQALVRLPLQQSRRDRAAELNTAGFISGYRGSPLGTYDTALTNAQRHLAEQRIHFQPAINEDLAATAIWGTQQVNLFPGARAAGVFAIWYGKGPGADRSADVFKHGNAAGTSPRGGVLAVVGDDHACQSSTLPHQSEQIFEAAMIPVLAPANVRDILDFGLVGFAMSRFSGCWVGLKVISELADCSASIPINSEEPRIIIPEFEMPAGGLGIRWPDPAVEQERRLHGPKMAAVAAFAQANSLDKEMLGTIRPRLGIAAPGKAYRDVRQALYNLGIDEVEARRLGIALYKIGMPWPLEAKSARRFADGLSALLVIEEKRDVIERQFAQILYNHDAARRPVLVGKRDIDGAPQLPTDGELTPLLAARAIVATLRRLDGGYPDMAERLNRIEQRTPAEAQIKGPQRIAFFCSGCPHSSSTRLPEGSRAIAGIGCHGMVMQMPERQTTLGTHMGGEGATWIGQSPFLSETHVFQNLGDGTYQHSGLLAMRAAAAAGVNITYKILFNGSVAMTGGQPVEGLPDIARIARQVAAEGAKKVVVVSDAPGKLASAGLPGDVDLRHRSELDIVQRQLREIAGLTVLIYDQSCAADRRRRRKQGREPELPRHVLINEAVCEDCGDCSKTSNCLSVKPVNTVFGRKRAIDRESCNQDYSCVEGFCPSFVTVRGGILRRTEPKLPAAALSLPEPAAPPVHSPYNILIAGIGGTGVVTAGAVLGMAAHLEGRGCTVLDLTGLAQKNGAVLSQIRIGRDGNLHAFRIGPGGTDLLLACDMVVATEPESLQSIRDQHTHAIVNCDLQPTASFVINAGSDADEGAIRAVLTGRCGEDRVAFIPATDWAARALGDTIQANMLMLGYAFQKGLLPIRLESLLRAIELNGRAVEPCKRAIAWGRLAAADPTAIARCCASSDEPHHEPPQTLADLVELHTAHLTAYQDERYAQRFRKLIKSVAEAERLAAPGREDLARAAARGLARLMAVKDEYEVARLYTDGAFLEKIARLFGPNTKAEFHFVPPLFSRIDPGTGRPRKRAYGPWMWSVLSALARLKHLRGKRWDPFAYTAERQENRRVLADYESLLQTISTTINPANYATAVKLAALPDQIRGFGPVRRQSVREAKVREQDLLAQFDAQ